MADEKYQDEKNLFVELQIDIKWIRAMLENHLQHHWAVQLVLLTFIGGLITALVIVLLI